MVSIIESNRYRPTPQQKRKAYRGYIPGTKMTRKKPGDYVITENGVVLRVNKHGQLVHVEAK